MEGVTILDQFVVESGPISPQSKISRSLCVLGFLGVVIFGIIAASEGRPLISLILAALCFFVRLRFIDRATGRYYVKWNSVNHWRGLRATGFEIWKMMNWLITEHWDIWKEDFARERNYDAWREYNKNTRKV